MTHTGIEPTTLVLLPPTELISFQKNPHSMRFKFARDAMQVQLQIRAHAVEPDLLYQVFFTLRY